MSRQFDDLLDEDECCLNCGEIDYQQSKIPGLCQDCFTNPKDYIDLTKEMGTED